MSHIASVKITDRSNAPQGVDVVDGVVPVDFVGDTAKVQASSVEELLMEVIRQLKVMNLHLGVISDMQIDTREVE
jgi:hypothetical protein